MIGNAVHFSVKAVIISRLPVAVGIHDLLRPVFLCHLCKSALRLADTGGRVVQEHNIFPVSRRARLLERRPQSYKLPVPDLLKVLITVFTLIAIPLV